MVLRTARAMSAPISSTRAHDELTSQAHPIIQRSERALTRKSLAQARNARSNARQALFQGDATERFCAHRFEQRCSKLVA